MTHVERAGEGVCGELGDLAAAARLVEVRAGPQHVTVAVHDQRRVEQNLLPLRPVNEETKL